MEEKTNIDSLELNDDILSYIEDRIRERNYDKIIDLCLDLLEKGLYGAVEGDKENLYELLEKLTIICDKTYEVAKKIVPILIHLINNSDEWVKIQGLIIADQISKYYPLLIKDIIEIIEYNLTNKDVNIRELALNIVGHLILNIKEEDWDRDWKEPPKRRKYISKYGGEGQIEELLREEEKGQRKGYIKQQERPRKDEGIAEEWVIRDEKTDKKISPQRLDIYFSLLRPLSDDSWRIRLKALKIFKDIALKGILPNDFFNQYIELVSGLINDDEEEVQSFSVHLLKDLYYKINLDVFRNIILKLLNEEEWDIRDKVIWIIGEVGEESFETIAPTLEPLIDLLKGSGDNSSSSLIRTKIIDAFVKIGRKYPEEIINFLVKYINDENRGIYSYIFEIFLCLTIEKPESTLPLIFSMFKDNTEIYGEANIRIFKEIKTNQNDETFNPDYSISRNSDLKNFISKLLIKLKDEIPEQLESEIAKLFSNLNNLDWRVRYETIKILGDLNFIFNDESIACWIDIVLSEKLENNSEIEMDPEVIELIKQTRQRIRNAFKNIDVLIKEIIQQQNFFYKEMDQLHNIPKLLEGSLNKILEYKGFRELECVLEDKINEAIKRIENFGRSLYNYRFKRLAIDLFEDWSYSRLDLLEEISEIRQEFLTKIEELKKEYTKKLIEKTEILESRIKILESELEYLYNLNTELKVLIQNGKNEEATKKLEHLSYIRDKIYRIEAELGNLWIENLDFKDLLKNITVYWVKVKIEAQQLLFTITFNLKELENYYAKEKVDKTGISKNISEELLLNQFQTLILQSSRNLHEQHERFSVIIAPVKEQIQKGNYNEAENILELAISQTKSSIENFDNEIKKIYQQLDDKNLSIEKAQLIRKYFEDWNNIKDSLIEKADQFYENTMEEIFINRINHLHRILNPLPLKPLARYLKKSYNEILDKIFYLLSHDKLEGKIIEDNYYLPEYKPIYEKIFNVYKKVEYFANNIFFRVKLENVSQNYIHNCNIMLMWPDFLELDAEYSSPKVIIINECNPNDIKIFKWKLKIKAIEPKTKTYVGSPGEKSILEDKEDTQQILNITAEKSDIDAQKSLNEVDKKEDNNSNNNSNNINKVKTRDKVSSYLLGEIKLVIQYQDMFEIERKITKNLEILIRN
ncbi:MAG: hypothetical protein ACTSU2_13165 [Promethearchaeota archaeon]